MSRLASSRIIVLCIAVLFGVVGAKASVPKTDVAGATVDIARVERALAGLPAQFVPNAGQWNPRAAFAARTFAGMVFVTNAGELVYSLAAAGSSGSASESNDDHAAEWLLHSSRRQLFRRQ